MNTYWTPEKPYALTGRVLAVRNSILNSQECQRRAKISYRAFTRAVAHKSAKTRARRAAARHRRLTRPPSEQAVETFRREQMAWISDLQVIMAAQRGQRGIEQLRRHQLKVRADCLLCHRPFGQVDRDDGA